MTDDTVFPVGDAAYDAVYAQEAAMIEASELIAHALESSGMSQADLARALGVSRSEVTARLKGERNITVRKLSETLHALGATLTLGSESRHHDRGRALWRLDVPKPPPTPVGMWKMEGTSHGR